MENPCEHRGRKYFPFCCYCICIHNKQPCTRLDFDCCQNRMLFGCRDCAQAYSATSAYRGRENKRLMYNELSSELGELFGCINDPVQIWIH